MDTSLVIGIIGVIIALYQGFEKRRLSRYLRSQSWYIYSMSLVSWSNAQSALNQYKESEKEKLLNPSILESLAKCDAFNFSLSLEAIRQIQLSEPRFDLETIMTWTIQGKIPKDHAPLFLRILSLEPPNKFQILWQTFFIRLNTKLQKKVIQQPTTIPDTQKNSEQKNDVGKS